MNLRRAALISMALAVLPCRAAAAGDDGMECLLEPAQVVEIRAAVDGIISNIAVQRGDTIRRGQTLVELQSAAERAALDSARYRARMDGQVASARNRIDYATKKLARLIDLQRDNFTTVQARDEAEAEKRLAESELQSATETRGLAMIEVQRAQEQLALRSVVSPFNGVVVDRLLNPGDLAESGSGRKPVLKIAQIDPMRADVALPAALFGRVRPGTRASIVATVGGARFAGTVRNVDRVIDAASSTFVARLELANAQGAIPSGSRCRAYIEGLVVPVKARP